jgi:predicted nucleic acid-binding protein
LFSSIITYAEMLVGFEKETAQEAEPLLNHYEILSIDALIAEKTVELWCKDFPITPVILS